MQRVCWALDTGRMVTGRGGQDNTGFVKCAPQGLGLQGTELSGNRGKSWVLLGETGHDAPACQYPCPWQ